MTGAFVGSTSFTQFMSSSVTFFFWASAEEGAPEGAPRPFADATAAIAATIAIFLLSSIASRAQRKKNCKKNSRQKFFVSSARETNQLARI